MYEQGEALPLQIPQRLPLLAGQPSENEEWVHDGLRRQPVNGRLDGLQGVSQAVEAFRMADDEIAAGMQLLDQSCNHLALGFGIEIDHHVAQEDDVELAQGGQRPVQVDLQEARVTFDFGSNHETALLAAHTLQAVLSQVGIQKLTEAVLLIRIVSP